VRKESIESKVAALEKVRSLEDRERAAKELRKALAAANNYYVSKAAALAAELNFDALTPDLKTAFDRFLAGGAATDPQCWAKLALCKALRDLNYDESDVYLAGITCRQIEPVWGGSVDTASALRGVCALALIATRLSDFDILSQLTNCLADPEKTVRMDAAAALGQLGRPEGGLLLRLKAMTGDAEPEVTGQCFHSLLAIAPEEAVAFVGRYLHDSAEEIQLEAAIALAQSREPSALDKLRMYWKTSLNASMRKALLVALGASPLPASAEWLAAILRENPDNELGRTARRALSASRFQKEYESLL
jgi:HEAT repeat protein